MNFCQYWCFAGTLGINGDIPTIPDDCWQASKQFWENAGFECTYWKKYSFPSFTMEEYYTVIGKNGTKAGDGGNGGIRGNPGRAGKMLLFELEQAPKLNISKNDGNKVN